MADEKTSRRGPSGLRALERAASVLDTLAKRPRGMSLGDLAEVTDLPASTVHRLLGVLRQIELVRETPSGLHALGVGTVVLAGAFLEGLDLREEARKVMRGLVEETKETCHLGVLASAQIVYVEKIDSPQPVRMFSRVGGTNPALSTAIGRAILAYSPPELVAATSDASRQLLSAAVDVDETEHILDEVRRSGFSTDLEDNEIGICCVGAPIFDHDARALAAISVSVPTARFDHARLGKLGHLIRGRADEISRALGWREGRSGA